MVVYVITACNFTSVPQETLKPPTLAVRASPRARVQLPVGAWQPRRLARLPPELRDLTPGECDPAVQARVANWLLLQRTRGKFINDEIRKSRGYRNPEFFAKMVEHLEIDQYGTAFAPEVCVCMCARAHLPLASAPRQQQRQDATTGRKRQGTPHTTPRGRPPPPPCAQVFDPHNLPAEDYLDALLKEQAADEERRKQQRSAGQGRVEFTKSGGWRERGGAGGVERGRRSAWPLSVARAVGRTPPHSHHHSPRLARRAASQPSLAHNPLMPTLNAAAAVAAAQARAAQLAAQLAARR